MHGGLALPPRRRRGPATPASRQAGASPSGPGTRAGAVPEGWAQAGAAARKRLAGPPARPGRSQGTRRGGGEFGGGRRGGSRSSGRRWRGRASSGEDSRRSPREPRFCKSWPLTYGNDARAGPHARPFEGRPPRTSAPPAKYCPASCALTKPPPSLCRALETGSRLYPRNGEADRR